MNTRRLVIGMALTATAVLSACSTERDVTVAANGVGAAQPTTQSPALTTTPTPTRTTTSATSATSPSSRPASTSPSTSTKQPLKSATAPPDPASTSAPCSAAASACVDLSANKAWLLENGKVTYGPVPITSGRAGYRTPPGTFRVQWKDIDHRSSQFNDAPMPYSVFFNGGIAFHQGSLKVQSHGCIHLSAAAAKAFYELPVGAVVEVVR